MKIWCATWTGARQCISILACVLSLGACAVIPAFGGDTWKEEVLLHDGRKVMVERSEIRGGRSEVGQPSAVTQQSVTFTLPDSGRTLSWTSEFGPDIGRTNFNPLALHIVNDTPYLVAEPNLCLSYNKWGRPNPPYVVFKHDGAAWQHSPLEQLPAQLTTFNLVISYGSREAREIALRPLGYVSAEGVRKDNSELRQPEYQSILREPVGYDLGCTPMITNGKGLWVTKGYFSSKPNLEACLLTCRRQNFDEKTCPCGQFFKGE
jgi:hypothetical protein